MSPFDTTAVFVLSQRLPSTHSDVGSHDKTGDSVSGKRKTRQTAADSDAFEAEQSSDSGDANKDDDDDDDDAAAEDKDAGDSDSDDDDSDDGDGDGEVGAGRRLRDRGGAPQRRSPRNAGDAAAHWPADDDTTRRKERALKKLAIEDGGGRLGFGLSTRVTGDDSDSDSDGRYNLRRRAPTVPYNYNPVIAVRRHPATAYAAARVMCCAVSAPLLWRHVYCLWRGAGIFFFFLEVSVSVVLSASVTACLCPVCGLWYQAQPASALLDRGERGRRRGSGAGGRGFDESRYGHSRSVRGTTLGPTHVPIWKFRTSCSSWL